MRILVKKHTIGQEGPTRLQGLVLFFYHDPNVVEEIFLRFKPLDFEPNSEEIEYMTHLWQKCVEEVDDSLRKSGPQKGDSPSRP